MESTSHEQSRVSVCVAAKTDGTNLKPMIVFRGTVTECKVLCREFHTQAVIASSLNGWINIELTLQSVEIVIEASSSKQRLLAWGSYEWHIEDTVKKSLAMKKVDTVIVPGKCTKYVQASHVSWNQTFKANCTEKYDGWLKKKNLMKWKQAI